MRKVASEQLFCVLIYTNSYIFRICFILFIFLSNTYLIFDLIYFTLLLADRHGIAKYALTYIRRYTHTHARTKTKKYEKVATQLHRRFDSCKNSKKSGLKSIFEHIELLAKLLDYFLRSSKSNIKELRLTMSLCPSRRWGNRGN